MSKSDVTIAGEEPNAPAERRVGPGVSTMGILLALSFCHLLNDAIQALIAAIYPLLKESFHLTFTQIGLITFTFQMVGSVLQPLVGLYTDKYPRPYSLVFGMGITWCGLVLLALAPAYGVVLLAAGLVGLGSAIFHPESSRMARLASGGRHGFAQSLFQVGGNAGTAIGPLLAAGIIVPHGRRHILWFSILAFTGVVVLSKVGRWYRERLAERPARRGQWHERDENPARSRVALALGVLLVLMFSKFIYLAAISNYYTFYLMHRFGVTVQQSQVYLFLFWGPARPERWPAARWEIGSGASRSSGSPSSAWPRSRSSCPLPTFSGRRCFPS